MSSPNRSCAISENSPGESQEERLRQRADLLRTAAVQAYAAVADVASLPAEGMAWSSAQCEPITRAMVQILDGVGLTVARYGVELSSDAATYHYYLFDPEMGLIVDPTWQQFLCEPPADDMPDTFVGTRAEMQELCANAAVDPGYRAFWHDGEIEPPYNYDAL